MGIKNIIGGTFEFAGETVKKAAEIPTDVLGGMLEQGLKGQSTQQQKQTDDPSVSPKEYQDKTEDQKRKDEEEANSVRIALGLAKQFTQPTRKKEQTYAEKEALEDREKMAKENKEKEENKDIIEPGVKHTGKRKSHVKTGFEMKDSKTG
ncbi:MAG: hypothetical protein UT63_C0004G0017 [Candidatus Gottesmanbacteria bacterium GW2011_GWC2_39_8]|uniref:Uncharacterized protein n=1 Tax=Candidatus Gottesmanbacteria bacterium GW2011_GWC2_39_8 TaxID=1618450 RepID=A0A0G0SHN8_9BACT|nr:MAG: hypothetical protein UT63_C0004G0017 [Candidatus Gottesmanbacteria bacterium GW2011_GWC2_39_8]